MAVMEYRGYLATLEYSEEDEILHGRVVGIRDVISFDGSSVKELRKDFRAAVDHYLAHCARIGKEPEKPFSGKFLLRLEPDLHRELARAAARARKTLNGYVRDALEQMVRRAS